MRDVFYLRERRNRAHLFFFKNELYADETELIHQKTF